MDEEQPDPQRPTFFVVADKVEVTAPSKPRPTAPPPGRYVWLALLAVPAVLEVVALLVRRFGWTLSHTIWWAQGPTESTRWWLLGLPIFAFVQWVAFHFLLGPRVGGWVLVGALVVAFTFGVGAVLLNR